MVHDEVCCLLSREFATDDVCALITIICRLTDFYTVYRTCYLFGLVCLYCMYFMYDFPL